jgi:hypothetical protein
MLETPLFAVSDSARSQSSLQTCFGEMDDDDGELSAIRAFIGDGDFKLAPESRNLKQYESCGLLRRVRKDGSYRKGAQIFRDLHLCLDKGYAPAHQRITTKAIEETRHEMPQAKPHVLKEVAEAEVGSLRCFRMSEENFADALSAKLLGRYLEKTRPNAADVRASLMEWAGWACSEQIQRRPKDAINYPTARHRFNTVVNDPVIAAAIGCSAPSGIVKLCSVDSGAQTATHK